MSTADIPEVQAGKKLTSADIVRGQQLAFTCGTGVPLTLSSASAKRGRPVELLDPEIPPVKT